MKICTKYRSSNILYIVIENKNNTNALFDVHDVLIVRRFHS